MPPSGPSRAPLTTRCRRPQVFWRLAAEAGHAQAQFSLGLCLAAGEGVLRDEAESVRLYRLSAAAGHADAQFNLASCYRRGQGRTKESQRGGQAT